LTKQFSSVEAWDAVTPLYVFGLSELLDEKAMHSGSRAPYKTLEHQAVLDATRRRLEHDPGKMKVRLQTVEHTFRALKYWRGATHFRIKTLPRVNTEMSLHMLA
jgi:hypothetical protein